jgi:hypothetical protein
MTGKKTVALVADVTLRTADGRLYARGSVPVVNGSVDVSKLEVEPTSQADGAEGTGAEATGAE